MRAIVALLAMLMLGADAEETPRRPILEMVGDYRLPSGPGRWDYMSMDPAGATLVLAHLGDSSIVVVDPRAKAVRGQVRQIAQVHGVLTIPERDRIYATATGTNELVIIDAKTLTILARVPVGRYPDGLAYAAQSGKVYVSNKEGHTESVVDVHASRRVGTIDLHGEVGNSQLDPISGHIFVNAQGAGELVDIDPVTDHVVGRTKLPGCDGNHGLLIEPTLRLAFVACEGNDRLLVVDLRTRTVTGRFEVPGEPDVLAYDSTLRILYVATETGPVYMFKTGSGGVVQLGAMRVGPNAHTLAVNPVTHEVFFPLQEPGKAPVLRVMRPSK